MCECGLIYPRSAKRGSWETTYVNKIRAHVSFNEEDHGGLIQSTKILKMSNKGSLSIHDKVMEDHVQMKHTWWKRCTLHLDCLVDLVKQCNPTWRILSTWDCAVEIRAKAWGGSNIIKEMKAKVKCILDYFMYDILDLELSSDIPLHSWVV